MSETWFHASWLFSGEFIALTADDREAARLYKLAADQGDARAQANLGFFGVRRAAASWTTHEARFTG
jgi:TPR repeat protein